MNFEFSLKVNPFLEKLEMIKAIQIGETELQKLPLSDFHEVIGKTMTGNTDELANWVEDFFLQVSEKIKIKALYFEINEFDINTEYWYIDCFAFKTNGGLDPTDMDWLCDYDADSQEVTETVFLIEGFENLQKAFEKTDTPNDNLQNAKDWCEQIIIARFMEFIRSAHLRAKDLDLNWWKVPVYFTEHGYDFTVRSENKGIPND